MAKARAGYEKQIFYGTAGSTAATKLLHAIDVNVNYDHTRTDTTDRGDGLSVPMHTEQVVQLVGSITFTYRYFEDDATLALLIAAVKAGTDVAIVVHRYNGGEVMFDGDCTLTLDSPGPLTGGQELSFTATPSQDSGRKPAFS